MMHSSRRSTFIVAMVATLMLSLIGAGTASAVTCPEAGLGALRLDGIGSSLQKIAQEKWQREFNAACPRVTFSYEPRGSGVGLREWHAEAAVERGLSASGFEYVGTDDAPTAAQVEQIETSTIARARAGAPVVPVAQAAVAVIVNPPERCTVRNIDNEVLERVWNGGIGDWERVPTAREGANRCRGAITRVVRPDVSGTTYQFKHYLWLIEQVAIGTRDWLQYHENAANTTWPAATRAAIANGGSQLVIEVAANRGSIGYANLGDVDANAAEALIVNVLNGARGEATYGEPQVARETAANCASTAYRANLGREATAIGTPNLATVWTSIFGSEPTIARRTRNTRAYPICTLTWIVVTLRYETAGFAAGLGAGVREFGKWVVERGAGSGQALLGPNHYAELPREIAEGARTVFAEVRG